jgi:hypothetical protein
MSHAPEAPPAEAPAEPTRPAPEALGEFLGWFPPENWRCNGGYLECDGQELLQAGDDLHADCEPAALRLFAAAPALVDALAQALDGAVTRINRTLRAFDYASWQPGDAAPDLSELKADMRQQLTARLDEAAAMHAALVASGARS